MTTNYCPPFSTPTPSRIAADLIATATPPGSVRDVLTAYADRLATAGAFADLTAADARTVAQTITWEVLHGAEADGLRARADAVADGSWRGWDNPVGVVRAFTIAATVLVAL